MQLWNNFINSSFPSFKRSIYELIRKQNTKKIQPWNGNIFKKKSNKITEMMDFKRDNYQLRNKYFYKYFFIQWQNKEYERSS